MAQKTIRPLETNVNLRRILIAALDATTGDPTNGVVPVVGDLQILKVGAGSPAEATCAGTLTVIGTTGYYHYAFTQNELDTRGLICVRVTKAGLKLVEFEAECDQPNLYAFGKLQAASGTAMTLAAADSAVSTDYVGLKLSINNRERYIVSYDGSTKIAQVDSAFPTTPSAGDVYYVMGSTGFQAVTAQVVADAVWNSLRNTHTAAGSFGAALQVIRDGTASAGAASSITLDGSASVIDNYYLNDSIFIIAGTGSFQSNQIIGYVGATKVATVANAWLVQPDNTSVFLIIPQSSGAAGGGGGLTSGQVANAVWDALRSAHTTAGSFGQGVASVQGNLTGNVSGNVGGSTASVTGNVGGNLIGSAASVAAPVTVGTNNDKTGYRLSTPGVSDILDGAVTEPGAAFTWGGATLRTIIGWLGVLSRNKLVETPTLSTVRNSADNAAISTAVQSDDGTSYTRNPWS